MTPEETKRECEKLFQAGGSKVYFQNPDGSLRASSFSARRSVDLRDAGQAVYARQKNRATGRYEWRCVGLGDMRHNAAPTPAKRKDPSPHYSSPVMNVPPKAAKKKPYKLGATPYGAISPKMTAALSKAPATLQEVKALNWAVRRAAENSCELHYMGKSSAEGFQAEGAYVAKVVQARRALKRLKESQTVCQPETPLMPPKEALALSRRLEARLTEVLDVLQDLVALDDQDRETGTHMYSLRSPRALAWSRARKVLKGKS